MTPEIPDDVAAVVYDLDGTLVRLAVDWAAVAEELRGRFAEAAVDAAEWTVWDCYERADEHGLAAMVADVLAERELDGAADAERLPAANDLAGLEVPIGVCSLNSEAACRAALERHGLADDVDAVVGRDTVGPVKPDPAPLLAAVEALGVEPAEAFYIGNREKDLETARRAGVPFAYVSGDGPTE
ncbi:MAG: HAD family hydrolase [Halobacteriales archaeon]|nr:HAD family hydrolase [Halobacteriales archaeon]